MTYRFRQCVNAIAFKYFNEQCRNYLNKVFEVAIENNFQLRGSFQKLLHVKLYMKDLSSPIFEDSPKKVCLTPTPNYFKFVDNKFLSSLYFLLSFSFT